MNKAIVTASYSKTGLKPDRLSAWVDGIFAFSMTLLVITIDVPKVPIDQLPNAIYANHQNFTSYILSFLLLSIFWIQHQRIFNNIERINENFIWLNIFNMMFVVFIPFTTNLISDYNHSAFAHIMFNANLLVVGSMNFVLLCLVCKYKLANVEFFEIKPELPRFYILPITSIFAIAISFLSPSNSGLVYLAIPMIKILRKALK